MLLVFMIMVTALAFYGTQESPVLDLGFYSFQWLNIAVGGFQCVLILLLQGRGPIIVFARYSKQHHLLPGALCSVLDILELS